MRFRISLLNRRDYQDQKQLKCRGTGSYRAWFRQRKAWCSVGDRSGNHLSEIPGVSVQEVRSQLAAQRIIVGANGIPYTPFDMTARGLREIVRASVSYLNTDEELERLATIWVTWWTRSLNW